MADRSGWAALVNKILREAQVARLACGAIQLNQRQLDLLVAAVAMHLARPAPKGGINVIGVAAHDLQQLTFVGGVMMRDGGLDQVSGAVQLLAISQVGPAPVCLDGEVMGIEVAIRRLRTGHFADQCIQPRVELRVITRRKRIARDFDPLRHV